MEELRKNHVFPYTESFEPLRQAAGARKLQNDRDHACTPSSPTGVLSRKRRVAWTYVREHPCFAEIDLI